MEISKNKKKVVAMLMAIAMIVSLLPQVSLADTATGQPVKKGGAGEQSFKEDHGGNYSSYENPQDLIDNPQYGYLPVVCNAEYTTKVTPYSLDTANQREAWEVAEKLSKDSNGELGSNGTVKDSYYAWKVSKETKNNIGWQGTNYRIYDPENEKAIQSGKNAGFVILDMTVKVADWQLQAGAGEDAYLYLQHSTSDGTPLARPNLHLYNVKKAKLIISYAYAGTNTAYAVKGNWTVSGIDANQYVNFSNNHGMFVDSDSQLNYAYNGGMNSFLNPLQVIDKSGTAKLAVGCAYNQSSFDITMGNLNAMSKWSEFGFTDAAMFAPAMSAPTKQVTDGNETLVGSNTLDTIKEDITYSVKQEIPAGISAAAYYKSFVMEDKINDVLAVSKVTVTDREGRDRTAWFNISQNGNQVTATATESTLKDPNFYDSLRGQSYSLNTTASIKAGANLTPYISGTSPNQTMTLNTEAKDCKVTVDGKAQPGNAVSSKLAVPELKIESKADKFDWKVGEQVGYTVKVNQLNPKAIATDVIIQDTSLPACLEYDPSTIKVEGITDYKVDKKDNGWIITVPKLSAETITITYRAKAMEDYADCKNCSNGKVTENKATVTSGFSSDTKQAGDRVWVNSPHMNIEKTSDKEVYGIGERINYNIKVKNGHNGTIAKDIQIEDMISTEGIVLEKDSVMVTNQAEKEISGVDITYSKNGFKIDTNLSMVGGENPFSADMDKLNATTKQSEAASRAEWEEIKALGNQELNISYRATVSSEDLSGKTVDSIASAYASNNATDKAESLHQLEVKGPSLDLTKQVDKVEQHIGDVANYTINVTQSRDGATAENVNIVDTFSQQGMEIVEGSIKCYLNGEVFEPEAIELVDDETMTITTGKVLKFGEKIKVEYGALVKNKRLVGEQVNNSVTAKGDNTSEFKDVAFITVKEAVATATKQSKEKGMEITKKADKETAKYKDKVQYTVKLKNNTKDTVKNLVLTDKFSRKGMLIDKESIQLSIGKKAVTPKKIEYEGTTMTISTGKSLAVGEEISLTYIARITDKNIKSTDEIKNVVSGKTDNAKSETASASINKTDKSKDKNSKDGSAVQTGDDSNMFPIVIILIFAGMIAASLGITLYKRKDE